MKTCSFKPCVNRHDSHGYCANHARQFRKYGHPLSKEEVSASAKANRLLSKGALGAKWSEESKAAQSARLKGRQLNTGRTHFKKGADSWNKGIVHNATKGINNWQWKGDNVGYHALHNWINRELGRPETCVNCKSSQLSGHQIHWANISREYKRDITDWIRLCAKCHKAYDTNKLTLTEIRG